jgi:hypothetical protein
MGLVFGAVGTGWGAYLDSGATVAKVLRRAVARAFNAMGRPKVATGLLRPRGCHAFFISKKIQLTQVKVGTLAARLVGNVVVDIA